MTRTDVQIFQEGYEAAKSGKGLSDCPRAYYGHDAFTWRQGVQRRLDDEEKQSKKRRRK